MRSRSAWRKRSAKSRTGSPFAASVGVRRFYTTLRKFFAFFRETSALRRPTLSSDAFAEGFRRPDPSCFLARSRWVTVSISRTPPW